MEVHLRIYSETVFLLYIIRRALRNTQIVRKGETRIRRVRVARSRPSGLTVALVYLATALLLFLLTLHSAEPPSPDDSRAAFEASVTRDVFLSGGECALVHLGVFESETDARICCSRYQRAGAAGFLYAHNGAYYAVGNAYSSAEAAANAEALVRARGIDAGVIPLPADGVTLRLTATESGIVALENAYNAILTLEDTLFQISERIDSEALSASAARTFAAIAAHDFGLHASALSLAAGDNSDECVNALTDLCEISLALTEKLSMGDLSEMYLSAAVKDAHVRILTQRLAFLEECKTRRRPY